MTFHVGQAVECVDDDWGAFAVAMAVLSGVSHPVKGGKYVVVHVFARSVTPEHGCPALVIGGYSGVYASCCFRPIVERETDISIFTALLTPTKVDA